MATDRRLQGTSARLPQSAAPRLAEFAERPVADPGFSSFRKKLRKVLF
jgi:hypothetical protein